MAEQDYVVGSARVYCDASTAQGTTVMMIAPFRGETRGGGNVLLHTDKGKEFFTGKFPSCNLSDLPCIMNFIANWEDHHPTASTNLYRGAVNSFRTAYNSKVRIAVSAWQAAVYDTFTSSEKRKGASKDTAEQALFDLVKEPLSLPALSYSEYQYFECKKLLNKAKEYFDATGNIFTERKQKVEDEYAAAYNAILLAEERLGEMNRLLPMDYDAYLLVEESCIMCSRGAYVGFASAGQQILQPAQRDSSIWTPFFEKFESSDNEIRKKARYHTDEEAQKVMDHYQVTGFSLAEVRLRITQILFDKFLNKNNLDSRSYVYTEDDAEEQFLDTLEKDWNKGSYNDLLRQMALMETGDDITKNVGPIFYSVYALSKDGLHEAKLYNNVTGKWAPYHSLLNPYDIQSFDAFIANHAAQDRAKTNMDMGICHYLNHYLGSGVASETLKIKYDGATIENTVISLSGLIQACHLVGPPKVPRILSETESIIACGADGNGVEARYYNELFYGFNVDNIIKGYIDNRTIFTPYASTAPGF